MTTLKTAVRQTTLTRAKYTVQLPIARAYLDPRAEMDPSVGRNSLFMGLFWILAKIMAPGGAGWDSV